MAEKCFRCQRETINPVRARREVKTYSGESKYLYVLACLDCFETMDRTGLEVLGDDGEPLELERSSWREDPPRPEIMETNGRQMTLFNLAAERRRYRQIRPHPGANFYLQARRFWPGHFFLDRRRGKNDIMSGVIEMKKLAFLIVLALGCAACMPTVHVMRYTTAISPPTAAIEILRTKPADREYVEVGEVSIWLKEGALYQSLRDNAVLMLAEKAKELGADALILIGERQRGGTYFPVGRSVVARNKQDLVGVAIKYK